MFKAANSKYLVPFNGEFKLTSCETNAPADVATKKILKKQLNEITDDLDSLQRILHAHDHHAILLIFQGMDSAGKDGTIRAVLNKLDPAGCHVHSFKQPSTEELDHDFLWRTSQHLPGRGDIVVFNRSYYEEVLIVRVHPEYLLPQKLPGLQKNISAASSELWLQRFESIKDHEKHLARSGVVILKFWLHLSFEEQRKRFLSRLEKPHKHWKFSVHDVEERKHWESYMQAAGQAMAETSCASAPWYAIPADNKAWMRVSVANILRETLQSLDMQYPEVDPASQEKFDSMKKYLLSDS